MHTTALTLGWAVYQPFDTDHPLTEDETLQLVKPVSLELKSGLGLTPTIIPYSAHNACYKVSTSKWDTPPPLIVKPSERLILG